ncbi:MAG: O-antigen ligase family protein [Clostridia bacterium]|nr:O-antigen ligase family protein [Clostridia bacterium]
MQSTISSFFVKLFKNIAAYFPYSILGKVFYAICGFIEGTVSESIIGRFFKKKTDSQKIFKESIFGKIVLFPVNLSVFLANKISGYYNEIRKGSSVLYLIDNWNLVSIRLYGFSLISFGVIYGVLRLLSGSGTLVAVLFSLAVAILGGLFVIINRSLKSLFKGSIVLKSIGGIFYDNAANEHSRLFLEDDHIQMKGAVTSTVVGAVLAVCAFVLLPIDFICALFGAIFILIAFKHVHVGVFITAIAAPVIPTMALAALSILCAVSFILKLVRNKEYKFNYSPLYAPIALFALSYLMGTLNSFAFVSSVKIFMIHITFMIFYIVLYNSLANEKTYKAVLSSFVLFGGLVALYGVLQNFLGITGTASWVDENMFQDIKLRVYSTFDNPNVLGEFLVLSIPVCLALFLKSEKLFHKILYLGVLALMGACLIFTWSRGAWLGVMLAIMIYLVMTDKRWTLCALIIIVVIPFIPSLLASNSTIIGRFASIGNMADSSTAYRVSIWGSALSMIKDYWLCGIGPGSDAFSKIYIDYAAAGANFALHSHNLYLQLITELGISGLVVFVAIIIKFYKSTIMSVLENGKKSLRSSVTIASVAGISGLLFQGLTDYIWYNYKLLLIFWIVLAIGSQSAENIKDKKGGNI